MKLTIKQLLKNPLASKEVHIEGWVRNFRQGKSTAFIELNDGTVFKGVQVVLENDAMDCIDKLPITFGCSLSITGNVVLTPDMAQPFEVHAKEIELEGACPADYPMQKKRHTLEYLRTQAHLRTRTNIFNAVFRIRSLAAFAIHKFYNERDFMYVNTPILTASDAEGAGEMFQATTMNLANIKKNADGSPDYGDDFFGQKVGLTVSGQLNGEAFAESFKNIYTFGPTFRAEKSNTSRHLAEFWMMEPEIAFADLDDCIELIEDTVKYIITYVMDNAAEELEFLNKFVEKGLIDKLTLVRDCDFARISYTEAIEILKKSGRTFDYKPDWGIGLQSEHERYLAEEFYKRPVFITDYPKEVKAFYMRLNDDGKTVAATDLLVPGIGELVGASQREERMDIILKLMENFNLNEEDYWWYLELRKYGGTKHAGFGIGFERLIMFLTGMTNIRDVIPFPRFPGHADF